MTVLAQTSPEVHLSDQLLGPLGALALALLVLWLVWRAFSTGLVRVGKQVDADVERIAKEHEQEIADCRRDRDRWRDIALEALGVGERAAKANRLSGFGGSDAP